MRVKRGRDETIMPAFKAVVSLSPAKKSGIWIVTPKPAQSKRGNQSLFLTERFFETIGSMIRDAPANRKNANVKRGTETRDSFIMGPVAPQKIEARARAIKGLKLRSNFI